MPPAMTGDDLRRFRERRNLERGDLAQLLNQALGRRYDGESIARWERGDRPAPKAVVTFLENLSAEEAADTFAGIGGIDPVDDAPLDSQPGVDSAPGPGPSPQGQPALGGSPVWTRACTELWEMIATGVGMTGAALGSHALIQDGAIIAADAQALGAAWGRLAETNETFRRMLVGMTEGGVWLQVALVTGTTVSKCWQSHAAIAASAAEYAALHNLDGNGTDRAAETAAA